MHTVVGIEVERWGIEPICLTLPVAPSTYYGAKLRPPSARVLRDDQLKVAIRRVHRDNFGVYGVEKVWRQLHREAMAVGRDRVARLMRDLGRPAWCVAKRHGPRSPAGSANGRPTWSSGTSALPLPTDCGSPI